MSFAGNCPVVVVPNASSLGHAGCVMSCVKFDVHVCCVVGLTTHVGWCTYTMPDAPGVKQAFSATRIGGFDS